MIITFIRGKKRSDVLSRKPSILNFRVYEYIPRRAATDKMPLSRKRYITVRCIFNIFPHRHILLKFHWKNLGQRDFYEII